MRRARVGACVRQRCDALEREGGRVATTGELHGAAVSQALQRTYGYRAPRVVVAASALTRVEGRPVIDVAQAYFGDALRPTRMPRARTLRQA